MKTVFKVFGLEETEFLTGASLSSCGISTCEESIVVRKHVRDFKSEIEAIEFLKSEDCKEGFEHGFEIVKTLQF
jgi:hypothetical protein